MTNSDFSIGGVSEGIGTQLDTEKQKLGDMIENFDADDPMATFKIEMEVAKYKAELGLMSALVKDIGEAQQQIIQKI